MLPSIHADARYIDIVSKACVFCTEGSDNNAHYWMFTVNVAATPTGLLYYQLPLNHAPEHLPRIPAMEPVPERLCCVICGDLFFDPVAVCDAHVFCRVCILRHIDGNKSCPLDRLPLSPESIRQSGVRGGNPPPQNLLEDTDGLSKEGGTKQPISDPSRCSSLLLSLAADARSSGDVIAFGRLKSNWHRYPYGAGMAALEQKMGAGWQCRPMQTACVRR